MTDEQEEDRAFVSRIGPIDVDWPRSIGFFGGIAIAVALDLIAPEIALFVACVPLVKLFKRKQATQTETLTETLMASVIEGAAKPLGGDAQETVRPAWLDELARARRSATQSGMGRAATELMPEEMSDRSKHGLTRFAREHPALSVLGVAGIGLLGGLELATGVLLGAGVVTALRATNSAKFQERARALLDRAPSHVRERVRAVLQAARGKIAATDNANRAAPAHEESGNGL